MAQSRHALFSITYFLAWRVQVHRVSLILRAGRDLVRFKYLDWDGVEVSTGQEEVGAFDEADARARVEGPVAPMTMTLVTADGRQHSVSRRAVIDARG